VRIHLIKERTVYEYLKANPQATSAFENWLRVLNTTSWNLPSDILESFSYADILGNGTKRVVFSIGGNKYRCICSYYFGSTFVHLFINWIGTHKEYDKLCDNNSQYTVSVY